MESPHDFITAQRDEPGVGRSADRPVREFPSPGSRGQGGPRSGTGAVNLLSWENEGPSEYRLAKIVGLVGGTVNPIRLTAEMAGHPEALKVALPIRGCLIASARTLAKLSGDPRSGAKWRQLLADLATHVLVYGFEPTPGDQRLLQELTLDSLVAVERSPTDGGKINVAQNRRDTCGQLAGLSFDAIGSSIQSTFVAGAEPGACSALLALGQKPFFVHVNAVGCHLLLLAGEPIADLDAPVPRGTSLLEFFPTLAPVLMFLRSFSKQKFWHNDAPAACFIVDDPLLTRRYGFLDYHKLLELMERRHFCTSIAFIPWNHRRSDRRVAEFFASRPGAFSLCVHGCDHTRGEFGSTNAVWLQEKARQAQEWMRSHRACSGIDFDDVMVFPQGIFSTTAMAALKSCGYLAAVNSTAFPIDAEPGLTLRDLLEVAVTRFADFPLFTRRYPQQLAELAFDLYLGKPALVVEHHGFFREGYDALAKTVERLRTLDEQLQWANLATICSRACLKKTAENGDVHVLFFTDRFRLRNDSGRSQQYVLIRRGSPEFAERAVTINGRRVDVGYENGCLQATLSLEGGEVADLEVAPAPREPVSITVAPGRIYRAGVFIRRSLSEFRDNYLDRSRLLSNSVSRAGRILRRSRRPA